MTDVPLSARVTAWNDEGRFVMGRHRTVGVASRSRTMARAKSAKLSDFNLKEANLHCGGLITAESRGEEGEEEKRRDGRLLEARKRKSESERQGIGRGTTGRERRRRKYRSREKRHRRRAALRTRADRRSRETVRARFLALARARGSR
ncbi:hypothetical protein BHE74_00012440 [Ensete ventricosum]|nr:hypothetical protein BHE74_00012440 [Ensete ventricosum]